MSSLAAIEQRVGELIQEVQHLNRRLLASEYRKEMRRLLPEVHALMGVQMWTAAELYAAAAHATNAATLLLHLEEWSSETGGLRSFGHMLDQCAGTVHGGLRLLHCGRDHNVNLYRVQVVSGSLKPPADLVE
jgi:hypothetical protein